MYKSEQTKCMSEVKISIDTNPSNKDGDTCQPAETPTPDKLSPTSVSSIASSTHSSFMQSGRKHSVVTQTSSFPKHIRNMPDNQLVEVIPPTLLLSLYADQDNSHYAQLCFILGVLLMPAWWVGALFLGRYNISRKERFWLAANRVMTLVSVIILVIVLVTAFAIPR